MRLHFLFALVALAACGGKVDVIPGPPAAPQVDPPPGYNPPPPPTGVPPSPPSPPPGADTGPVVLASRLVNPWRIAVDATNVYFTDINANTVSAVPIAGGPVKVLATDQFGASA